MIKLYGGARSRASIPQWYLEELGIPYEFVLLSLETGEHQQPDFLTINPFGKVPAIVDGDFKLWESGAILLYLAEKHGQIPTDLDKRIIYTQWVLFANATLATGIFMESSRERETPKLMTPLNQTFQQQPYVLGDEFTVVDVAVGSILAYIPILLKLDLSAYPNVLDYMKRMTERPAFGRSIGKGS